MLLNRSLPKLHCYHLNIILKKKKQNKTNKKVVDLDG